MKSSAKIGVASLMLLAPVCAQAEPKHPESTTRLAEAVNVAGALENSSFIGCVAIYVDASDRVDALKDADIAPFLNAKPQDSDGSAVLIFSPDRKDVTVIYFTGDQPRFESAAHGEAHLVSDIASSIKPIATPAPGSNAPLGKYQSLPITADDGVPLDAILVGGSGSI